MHCCCKKRTHFPLDARHMRWRNMFPWKLLVITFAHVVYVCVCLNSWPFLHAQAHMRDVFRLRFKSSPIVFRSTCFAFRNLSAHIRSAFWWFIFLMLHEALAILSTKKKNELMNPETMIISTRQKRFKRCQKLFQGFINSCFFSFIAPNWWFILSVCFQ